MNWVTPHSEITGAGGAGDNREDRAQWRLANGPKCLVEADAFDQVRERCELRGDVRPKTHGSARALARYENSAVGVGVGVGGRVRAEKVCGWLQLATLDARYRRSTRSGRCS